MSEYDTLGLLDNPFQMIIADEKTAESLTIFGREDQIERLEKFVQNSGRSNLQKRIFIMGEYGTGKTHHLLKLQNSINSGDYGENLVAIYLGSLGISFRNLYENIVEKLNQNVACLREHINKLPDVEPPQSVEAGYTPEKLRKNIISNINSIIAEAKLQGIKGIFLLVDEAEDIAQSKDDEQISYFIQSLLHLVNELSGSPLHIVMGFSREALSRITNLDPSKSDELRLGEAFWQRFSSEEPVRLGNLRENDAKAMILDRLNNSRVLKTDSYYPIVEDVISIVNKLVGGHPREILSIFNKAVNETLKDGSSEIDGNIIVRVLATHESFFSKTVVLDWDILTSVKDSIEEELDETAAKDFSRLLGCLVGEGKQLKESDFSKNDIPEKLTSPIKDTRILERNVTEYGETFYYLSGELREKIFKGKRYDSETVQLLTQELIDLETNPERYQSYLARGFWQVIREGLKAELREKEETDGMLILCANVSPEKTYPSIRFAISAYKGREYPISLYESTVNLLKSNRANFGLVLYDGPNHEIDSYYQNFRRTLKERGEEHYLKNIETIFFDRELKEKDEKLFGELKLIGNPEINVNKDISSEKIIQTLNISEGIKELVGSKIIFYPEEKDRRIINKLAEDQTKSYIIKDLKNICESPYLNEEKMEVFSRQGFVKKLGHRWQISELEDGTPWKVIYSFIATQDSASFDEIKKYLGKNYILQCSPGDENRLIDWYIQNLILLDMIAVSNDGAPVKSYRLLDHGEELFALIGKCRDKIPELQRAIDDSNNANIPISGFQTKVKSFEARLEAFEDEMDPKRHHVSDCKKLYEDISHEITQIQDKIKETKSAFKSSLNNIETSVRLTLEKLESALEENVLSKEEKEKWAFELNKQLDQAKECFKLEDFAQLELLVKELGRDSKKYVEDIRERGESKEPCISYANKSEELFNETYKLLSELDDLGYNSKEIRSDCDALREELNTEYKRLFNLSNYTEAKKISQKVYKETKNHKDSLLRRKNEYLNLKTRLEDLNTEARQNPDLVQITEEGKKALGNWDFAEVENKIKNFSNKQKKMQVSEKSEEEIFKEKLASVNSFKDILHIYSLEKAFTLLRKLYQNGEVRDISIEFKHD
ncbi:hypothetical protein ACSAZK_17490 [Methanosarcina sp. Mfa9]|uniref:hypothetical protein n=1 Tax=Methanosarcina sp. Mfa9 TaxID=3439063 RepID=UPI003F85C2FD